MKCNCEDYPCCGHGDDGAESYNDWYEEHSNDDEW